MFPTGFVETAAEETTEDVGVDFLFDYDTGQHLMTNTVLAECSTLMTVKQFIQNVLRTAANAYSVYTKNEDDVFGLTVFNYIGQRSLPMGYINSELKREVTEQLTGYPLIEDVSNWTGTRERRGIIVSFTVTLTDGTILEEEELVTAYYTPSSSENNNTDDNTDDNTGTTIEDDCCLVSECYGVTAEAIVDDDEIVGTFEVVDD